MNIGFISLGCSKNLVDIEYIIGLFPEGYFKITDDPRQCDVIVINTCGFILEAKKEAINTILEMAEYKKDRLKKLIVCGCFVQRYLKECYTEFPEVDLFVPLNDYPKWDELLKDLFKVPFNCAYGTIRKPVTKDYTAYLKISDGCDNRCAYCAIPLIRGNCHSYPIEKLYDEALTLYREGCKELNLVAQDTTYYGHDLYGHFALKELLEKLTDIPFEWIRILYMYPDEIEEDLLVTMKKCHNVLPYFDIPIQAGSDKILKLMNRRGNSALIKEKIAMIRKYFPDAVIRTTIIVGFPQESEEDFQDTLDLIKEVRFDSLGAFTYSQEDDTPAYFMEQVSEEIKERRYAVLMETQKAIVQESNAQRINKKYKVLIERYESLFDRYVARAYFSAPDGIDGVVYVKSDKELQIGNFYSVEISGAKEYDLLAKY